MKILSSEQIRWLDNYTIEHEPISSIDLMERAAWVFSDTFLKEVGNPSPHPIIIFCGSGNNGGDGFAIARLLKSQGLQVEVYWLKSNQVSEDCAGNKRRFEELQPIHELESEHSFPKLQSDSIIVDALFGSGLNRPLSGLASLLVNHINRAAAKVFSVDVPSGLLADEHTPSLVAVIHSTFTFTFHAPKLAFMMPENEKAVGKWQVLDIGLSQSGEQKITSHNYYIQHHDVTFLQHADSRFAHKGRYGHALIAAGSYGMMGAAVFCASAAARSGCGLISVAVPACGYEVMQNNVPEAMIASSEDENEISLPPVLEKFSAIAIGPGIGLGKIAGETLSKLLASKPRRLVIDADALNLLSKEKKLLHSLPSESVLTPHPGEFRRLAGNWANDFNKLHLLKNFAKEYGSIVVLKGAHTIVADAEGQLFFNSTGNNGMAKGGSGDVLTGVIVSLLAQGFTPLQAAVAGVYVHGFAGNIALEEKGRFGMTAIDLVAKLPDAFKQINSAPFSV